MRFLYHIYIKNGFNQSKARNSNRNLLKINNAKKKNFGA
jgi:hypothetical protein